MTGLEISNRVEALNHEIKRSMSTMDLHRNVIDRLLFELKKIQDEECKHFYDDNFTWTNPNRCPYCGKELKND